MRSTILLPLALLIAAPASASTSAAWSAGDSAARNACIASSGLNDAAASAPVHFSDRSALDVILVTGRYKAKGKVKARPGTMLCLYNRRTGTAETQESGAWSKAPR